MNELQKIAMESLEMYQSDDITLLDVSLKLTQAIIDLQPFCKNEKELHEHSIIKLYIRKLDEIRGWEINFYEEGLNDGEEIDQVEKILTNNLRM